MKRAGNLIFKIASLDNLYLAFYKAKKNKESKSEIINFKSNLNYNLIKIQDGILNGNIKIGNYHFFTIYDPKERQICAADFPERILHHALMNICHPVFENQQIFDSYATRKNKGTYAALYRAEKFQNKNKWFLKLDIRKYFDSIDHKILYNLLNKKFKDKPLMQIFNKIINSYETNTEKGLPIGNLTSQYFANYYLSYVDRYIKNELNVLYYVRYMDDMVLWSNDKKKLLDIRKRITEFLKVNLSLSLKISIINKNTEGLNFLGYKIYRNKIKLNQRSKNRFLSKTKEYENNLKKSWSQSDYQRHILPLISFVKYAETFGLRTKVFNDMG